MGLVSSILSFGVPLVSSLFKKGSKPQLSDAQGLLGTIGDHFFSSYDARQSADYANKLYQSNVEQQLNANKALAAYKFDQDLDMWNIQNQYNLPVNQMERMKAAGWHPAIAMGSMSTGNATNLPEYTSVQTGLPEKVSWRDLKMKRLSEYQDLELRNAQIDSQRSIAQVNMSTAAVNQEKAAYYRSQIRNIDLRSQKQSMLLPFVVKREEAAIGYINGNISLNNAKRQLVEIQQDTEDWRGVKEMHLATYYSNAALTHTYRQENMRYVTDHVLPSLVASRWVALQYQLLKNKITFETYNEQVAKIRAEARIEGLRADQIEAYKKIINERVKQEEEKTRLQEKYGSPWEQLWPKVTGNAINAVIGIGAAYATGGLSLLSPQFNGQSAAGGMFDGMPPDRSFTPTLSDYTDSSPLIPGL